MALPLIVTNSSLQMVPIIKHMHLKECHIYDCNGETPIIGCTIIDFIPDIDMKQNELTIEIPDGKIVDWDESKKQNKIVLKDKENTKPRSWEEYCEQHNTTVTECYFIDNGADVRVAGWYPDIPSDMLKNALPSKELAEAFLAMMQLMSLRQEWIGNWEPDWENNFIGNWCVISQEYKLKVDFF